MSELQSSLHIWDKVRERADHLTTIFLDALFLVAWVALNYGVLLLTARMHLDDIDQYVLQAAQVLFGLATLAPICIWIYRDVRIIAKRAARDIRASQ
jgi:hypothetical protein